MGLDGVVVHNFDDDFPSFPVASLVEAIDMEESCTSLDGEADLRLCCYSAARGGDPLLLLVVENTSGWRFSFPIAGWHTFDKVLLVSLLAIAI